MGSKTIKKGKKAKKKAKKLMKAILMKHKKPL